jgi:hypothetical protein
MRLSTNIQQTPAIGVRSTSYHRASAKLEWTCMPFAGRISQPDRQSRDATESGLIALLATAFDL